MATINVSDVLASVTSYIEKNNRPCPAHFLTQKFGDDVIEAIGSLKKDGKIVGRRGRNGGIVLPDTVIVKKDSNSTIEAKAVDTDDGATDIVIEADGSSVPF